MPKRYLFIPTTTLGMMVSISIASSSAMLYAQSAQARPIAYDFTVDVTAGSLSGMQFSGSICYDDTQTTDSGTEVLRVAHGLEVSMTFFNQFFTAKDDVDYPHHPTLTLEDGLVESLDFWIESGERVLWWNLPGWDVTLTPRATAPDCPAAVAGQSAE